MTDIEITQADREFAGDIEQARLGRERGYFETRIREGTLDHSPLVHAVAKFRLEARAAALEEAAKVIEQKHTNNVGMVHPMAVSDATAIRALKGEQA